MKRLVQDMMFRYRAPNTGGSEGGEETTAEETDVNQDGENNGSGGDNDQNVGGDKPKAAAPTPAPVKPKPATPKPVVKADEPKEETTKIVFTADQQNELNRMMAEARKEGRNAAAREASAREAEAAKEAERLQAIKDGDLQKQLQLEREQRETAQQELNRVRDETIRLRVAAKHSLPEGWHERLKGADEAEYEADAKLLAKQIAPPKAPNLEAGQQPKGNPDDLKAKVYKDTKATNRYNF